MPAKVIIVDPGTRKEATVTRRGELVVSTLDKSVPYYISIAVLNTSYEIVKGIAGKEFVITDIILSSDKNFASATAGEPVVIYGAHPADIDTIIDTFLNIELLKNDRLPLTGLNWVTAESCSVVGIATTDAAVDVTVAGYFVDA
jgi:hypothetical protein